MVRHERHPHALRERPRVAIAATTIASVAVAAASSSLAAAAIASRSAIAPRNASRAGAPFEHPHHSDTGGRCNELDL